MKQIIAAVLIALLSVNSFEVTSEAFIESNSIVVMDINSSTKKLELYFNDSTATCKSSYYASNSLVSSISATQTLEKKGLFGIYSSVSGASWTKTVNSSNLSMSNTKSNLSSGTYRLKTVFTVTLSSGTSETVTVYSTEKTV